MDRAGWCAHLSYPPARRRALAHLRRWRFLASQTIRRRPRLYRSDIADVVLGTNGALSFVARFPEAKRRCLTTVIGLPDTIDVLMPDATPITDAEAREIAFIRSRPDGHVQHMRLAIQVDFSDRFLAKVSIGLAHTVLGPAASASPYLAELRRILWSRSSDERENSPVRGTGFWSDGASGDRLSEFVGCRGAWVIMLQAFPQAFALVLSTPSTRLMTMMISDDPSLWPPHIGPRYSQGIVHLVVPQRSRAFGPIPLQEFISHKLGHMRQPELLALETLKTDPARLPPMRLTAHSDSKG
jgi:hypothetical protein